MADFQVLEPAQVEAELKTLPGWEVREGWLRRTFNTPGWEYTMMAVQVIGFIAEAADHHPDLSVGYAKVTVKIQTHRTNSLTLHDFELARRIDEVLLWQPGPNQALSGFPKRWIH